MQLTSNTFFSGSAGTGKSYTIEQIIKEWRSKDKNVTVVAPTGNAAYNVKGRTIHSAFGYRVGEINKLESEEDMLCYCENKLSRRFWTFKNYDCDLLIIDEISMVSDKMFNLIDYSMKYFHRAKNGSDWDLTPFGGVTVLISGDLKQLEPISGEYFTESYAYEFGEFEIVEFKENRRYKDPKLFEMFSKMRNGEDFDDSLLLPCIGRELENPLKIYAKRAQVDQENEKRLKQLENIKVFQSTDIFKNKDLGTLRDVEPLLKLAVGAKVMLKINLCVERGLYNGSSGVVLEILENAIRVDFYEAGIVDVTRHDFEFKENYRIQYPLQLAWAMTIHKCQGLTLTGPTEVHLQDCFSKYDRSDSDDFDPKKAFEQKRSQRFVALSRFRTLDNVSIFGYDKSHFVYSTG